MTHINYAVLIPQTDEDRWDVAIVRGVFGRGNTGDVEIDIVSSNQILETAARVARSLPFIDRLDFYGYAKERT